MKNIHRVGLSLISGSLLAMAAWALPVAAPSAKTAATSQNGVLLESVSGTVVTVARDAFTLTTPASAPQGMQVAQVDDTTKTMMFVIDQNTTIDGRLRIGASADVVYRKDAGNNMAVSVTVSK
jgi:hypothetical protein